MMQELLVSGMQESKKLKVKVDANVKGRMQKRKTRITNVKGINNPTTFGQVEKTSSKTIVIMDPKTKAKKSPCLQISRVSKAQKL
jgi:hypothetical protein